MPPLFSYLSAPAIPLTIITVAQSADSESFFHRQVFSQIALSPLLFLSGPAMPLTRITVAQSAVSASRFKF